MHFIIINHPTAETEIKTIKKLMIIQALHALVNKLNNLVNKLLICCFVIW